MLYRQMEKETGNYKYLYAETPWNLFDIIDWFFWSKTIVQKLEQILPMCEKLKWGDKSDWLH